VLRREDKAGGVGFFWMRTPWGGQTRCDDGNDNDDGKCETQQRRARANETVHPSNNMSPGESIKAVSTKTQKTTLAGVPTRLLGQERQADPKKNERAMAVAQ